MLRLNQPARIYEWGEGTSTLNQVWTEIGSGRIVSAKRRADGVTEVVIKMDSKFEKKNRQDDTIRILQRNSNMTPASDAWGEAASGRLRSVSVRHGVSLVQVEVETATKVLA